MKRNRLFSRIRHPVVFVLFSLCLSFVLFLQIYGQMTKIEETEVTFTIRCEHLGAEVCEAIATEEIFYLDGRFPLYVNEISFSPTLLRFYDGEEKCEFTVPSKKYSTLTLSLSAPARTHSYGAAVGGVRTVNVGMGLSLYGDRTKLYGVCTELFGRSK